MWNGIARNVTIECILKNKNITNLISENLLDFAYTDNSEDKTDDISFSLADTEGIWIKKYLKTKDKTEKLALKGAEVRVKILKNNFENDRKIEVLDCGIFELDSVSYSAPPKKVELKATSIPYESKLRQMIRTEVYKNTKLKNIANKIAKRCKMELSYYSEYNPSFKRKEQKKTSDIAFLKKICKDAGISLKVTSNKLVLFDAEYFEKQKEKMIISSFDKDILNYRFDTKLHDVSYNACTVKYTDTKKKKTYEGTFRIKKGGQTLKVEQKVGSNEEAKKLAKKKLREKNKSETSAKIDMVGNVNLVAGIVVKLEGFGEFDGKYIIEQATHNVTGGYKTSISLRKCLEGY